MNWNVRMNLILFIRMMCKNITRENRKIKM